MKIKRLVVFESEREPTPLEVCKAVSNSLLLSNSIRRDTVVEIKSPRWLLRVYGWRVKHLRMDEGSCIGFARRAVWGRGMPGTELLPPNSPSLPAEYVIRLPLPLVEVSGRLLPSWLVVAVALMQLDRSLRSGAVMGGEL